MLHEVRQPLLVVPLHQRARVDPQPERGLTRRGGVVHQGVAHAVGHQAVADGGVGRNVAGRLRPGIGGWDLGLGLGGGREGQDGDGEGPRRKSQARGRDKQKATRRTHEFTPKRRNPRWNG